MKTFKATVKTLIVLFVLAVIVGLVYMYSGAYDVAAVKPHSALTRWVLNTTKRHSIKRHAENISVPPLNVPARVREGFEHYHEMCAGCHGAPGVKPDEFSRGMNPHPPDLKHAAKYWKPAQLFWIVKNGIKMTGMGGLAPTHSDQKIWDIVAFLEKLPEMTPQQYQQMKVQADQQEQKPETTPAPTQPPAEGGSKTASSPA
ncbi:MAG: cytochrome c [Acidobacteriota bacterium]|jgi:mono/diheme cytochrome c family protein